MRCGQERRNGGREAGKREKCERKREEKRKVVEVVKGGKDGGWE